MILLIDNYDSFTYNLVQALAGMGAEIRVERNDAITVAAALALQPAGIIISPGPGTPDDAGISVNLIRAASGMVPMLGVCLGHQAVGNAFGARVIGADAIMHGKTSLIRHQGKGLYRGMRNPFPAGRYHSLSLERASLPGELVIEAETEAGDIMGLRHRDHPIYGVQFHPESVLTPSGKRLLRNFLEMTTEKQEEMPS